MRHQNEIKTFENDIKENELLTKNIYSFCLKFVGSPLLCVGFLVTHCQKTRLHIEIVADVTVITAIAKVTNQKLSKLQEPT